jgi:O-antigen/teichoic acid export membrane protein
MNSAPAKQPPSLAVQALWLTASKFIAALLMIALPILMVRLMSQQEFGLYKQAFMFIATAAIASMGVSQSAFYFIPRYPERGGQIALNIMIYHVLAGGLVLAALVIYPEFLQKLFRTDALNEYKVLLGVVVILALSSNLGQHIPTALQDVKTSTFFIVGMNLVKAVLFIVSALLFPAVKSLIIAALIYHLLATAALVWYLHKKFGAFWHAFEWRFFKEQLAYALPLGMFGLLYFFQKDSHNYFVSAMFGPADFAIYSVGCMQVPFVFVFLESVGAILVVRVSALQQQKRNDEVRRVVASAINRVAAIQFPAAALLLVTGRDLIVLLYTKTYEASYSVFAINILLLPLSAFLVDPIIRSYLELRKFVLVLRIILTIILLSTLAMIIHRFGMIGAVSAAVIVELIERLMHGWRASKAVEAGAKDLALFSDLAKITIVTVVVGLVTYFVRNLINPDLVVPRLVVAMTCFGALYLTAVYALKLPGSQELSKERVARLISSAVQKVRSSRA